MNNLNSEALAMIGPNFEEDFALNITNTDAEAKSISLAISTFISTVWVGSVTLASWASVTTSK